MLSYRLLIIATSLLLCKKMLRAQVLVTANYKHYVDSFNDDYPDTTVNAVNNEHCWEWMLDNIPFFDCPDKDLEKTYYFRWYSYRKHIKNTPDGFVITEFLPNVPWAGKYNTISCAAGHHFYEGRWLRNYQYFDQYAQFWLTPESKIRNYSGWIADAIYHYYLVSKNKALIKKLLPGLINNYQQWENGNQDSTGL